MTMTRTNTLDGLRVQRSALIREEALAGARRRVLEDGIRQAILRGGCDINEVSEASGLTPREIRSILDRPAELANEDYASLAGVV
jgi:hypothetical protein